MRDSRNATARRRRICIVTETYPPEINGVALTVARLTDGLRARGHAVSVVCPGRPARLAPAVGEVALDGLLHRTSAAHPTALALHDAEDPETTLVRGVALPCYRELRA